MRPYIRRTAAVVALALTLGACDDGLTEINENPNGPLDVPAENLLANALAESLDGTLVYSFGQDLTELWVQHMAEIQYAEEDVYLFRSQEVNGLWAEFYSGPLMDLERILEINEAAETPNANQVAVAEITQSWLFGIMTDMWGDIPYSEALTGHEESGTVAPAYDPQSEIYAGILSTLATAQDNLGSGTEGSLANGDLLYGGDMDSWKRFANSLRLRYAMHMADVEPATAEQAAAAAVNAGVFTSAAQQAEFHYTGSSPYWNPIYNDSRTRDDHRISETLVTRLQSLDDPRLEVYAQPVKDTDVRAAGTIYSGMPNGTEPPHPHGLTEESKFGVHFFDPAAPHHVMTYAEVLFLIAEAELRGWDISAMTAQEAYEAGVTAALELYEGVDYAIPGATPAEDAVGTWTVSPAEVATYLAEPEVAWTNPLNTPMQKIALQKWLLLYNQGVEAYANWRRMDYPVLTPGPDATTPDVPVRIPYPSDEEGYNGASLADAKNRQNITGEGLLVPVWWDID